MISKITSNGAALQRRLAQLQIDVRNLPGALQRSLFMKKGRLANAALREITRVPGPPVYPIRWKSQRQRKAFFASRGFGRGIPTRRNYELLRGWHVELEKTPDGGMVSLENPVPYMVFVQGAAAQPFHLDTGWVQKADVIDDFYKEVIPEVRASWREVTHDAVGADK